ncbi:MAG TPA: hypothetical protein VFH88_07215 [Candidatus Krumholzibacteria bacterium]|nr:hypothetical protein [Candidatus Krumholzibacteria bacterium]
MMDCIPVEMLGTLGQLPDDDPVRRHAATCPRCSARWFAYQEFVRAQSLEGADAEDADTRLARFIETHIEAAETAPVTGSPRRGRGRWFDVSWLRLGLAAVVLVVVAVTVWRWQPWVPKEPLYRGETSAHFTGLHAAAGTDGLIELTWDPVRNADAYRVTMLAQDLTEIEQLGPTPALSIRFDPSADGVKPAWYWQVTALYQGGELLTSDPQRLP